MDFFFIIFFFLSLLLLNLPTSHTQEEYTAKCQKPFTCGLLDDLAYPFWGGNRPSTCGHPDFELNCEESKYPLMVATQQHFRVLKVNLSSVSMTIARDDYFSNDGICQINPSNTTLDATILSYNPSGFQNISIFYNCTKKIIDLVPESYRFGCSGDGFIANQGLLMSDFQYSALDLVEDCETRVEVPIQTNVVEEIKSFSVETMLGGLREGFNISYGFDCSACRSSGGSCVNVTGGGYLPICDEEVKRKHSNRRKRIIGIVSGVVGALLLIPLAWIICQLRKRRKYAPSSYASRSISSVPSSRSDVEKGSRYMGAPLFTYTELADATNNFDERKELGDGGFGTVYYGKLKDGREVAVKRLYENNYRRVEQFMNEVDILTRLQHKNLVILYGCTSRHSRELLLVYEYIENGTVADHLHGVKARPGSLPWPLRLNIAVETARALTYLHASDIIHRDVKTNNILLDKNFRVKVADFGLSRLFPTDVTHISTAPQGTPGYVDPEYHQCYQLTNKSDVYSFGVVLAELISSLPAVDITRHRHEINLFNMAINKIQSQALHEFVDPSLGFSSDETVRKSISAVAELAFQCLQSEKELRPKMDEVLETLTTLQAGKLDPDRSPDNDTTSDDVGLLKYGASPLSPVSVTAKWSSSSDTTTPNTSS